MIRSAGTIRELGVRRNIVTGVIPIWCEIHRNKVSEHNTSDSFNPLSRRTEAAILNCTTRYLLAKMRFPSTIVCTITVSPYVNPHFIIETLESHTNSLPATGIAALFRFAFALNDITSLSRFTTFAAADDWAPTFGVIFFPAMADDFFAVSFFGAILFDLRKNRIEIVKRNSQSWPILLLLASGMSQPSKYYLYAYSLYVEDRNKNNGVITNPSAKCLRMCSFSETNRRIANTLGTK